MLQTVAVDDTTSGGRQGPPLSLWLLMIMFLVAVGCFTLTHKRRCTLTVSLTALKGLWTSGLPDWVRFSPPNLATLHTDRAGCWQGGSQGQGCPSSSALRSGLPDWVGKSAPIWQPCLWIQRVLSLSLSLLSFFVQRWSSKRFVNFNQFCLLLRKQRSSGLRNLIVCKYFYFTRLTLVMDVDTEADWSCIHTHGFK